jgi:ubiquinone biosynthesis protein UbiJ
MFFSSLQSAALEGVEKIINAALVYDPSTLRQLTPLQGKVLLVESSTPGLRIAVEVGTNGLLLHNDWQDSADVHINGSFVSILNMGINAGEMVSFSGTGVNVTGNLDVLRQLNLIMAGLDIDWEAALAELMGDVPAHILSDAVRKTANARADTLQRAKSAVVEVSQEELRLTPSKNEYDEFVLSVRHLATDTERLSARVNRLHRLFQSRNAP